MDNLVAGQLAKVEFAFAYFDLRTTELQSQLDFYEAARMFHPLLLKQAGDLAEPEMRRLLSESHP